jgi:hypothetical protein
MKQEAEEEEKLTGTDALPVKFISMQQRFCKNSLC